MKTAFEPSGRIVRGNKQVCYNPKHKCATCEHYNRDYKICHLNWSENCDHYFTRAGGRKGCLYRKRKEV